jgi:hypothetical protein
MRVHRTGQVGRRAWRGTSAVALAIALLTVARAAPAQTAALRNCERAIATGLERCFAQVSKRQNECYGATGDACVAADVARALARLASRVTRRCSDAALRQLGYGPLMTTAAMVGRLQEACQGEARTLAARTFGGPHGALLAAAAPDTTTCLGAAFSTAARLTRDAFAAQSRCIRRARAGRRCDAARVETEVASEGATATTSVTAACPNLDEIIAVDATEYGERALAQARCMLATAHPDPSPFALDCGTHAPVAVPPRGQWVLVTLDETVWGTRCGDGSPYGFWLRLAPTGAPIERVIVDLQGGGVCTNESECQNVPVGRFRALDSPQPTGGYRSTDPTANPFWDWTMLVLGYCNQDVYTGGGLTTAYPSITVHRFGALNVRASLRYLRDVLWREMDGSTPGGYRPDHLRVLFGGVSAGGFGVSYNYDYVLDDLRWVNTTAVPDSALGLNNGQLQGVVGLGILLLGTWGGQAHQPPFCFAPPCAVVPYRQGLTAPRLKGAPFQQILNVSNQVDNTQRATTFFSSSAAWTNAARHAYCTTQGLNGIRYFLPAQAASLHGMLQSSRFTTMTSDGVTLSDWLAAAMTDPDAVVDLVEEGSLTSNPSINPFACVVD